MALMTFVLQIPELQSYIDSNYAQHRKFKTESQVGVNVSEFICVKSVYALSKTFKINKTISLINITSFRILIRFLDIEKEMRTLFKSCSR